MEARNKHVDFLYIKQFAQQVICQVADFSVKKMCTRNKYTIWPKVSGQLTITPIWAFWTSYSKTIGINMELTAVIVAAVIAAKGLLFAAIAAATLLRRLSTRFWNVCVKICGTDIGREGPACNQQYNSSQIGLRSGLCAGQLSSSTPNSSYYVFMDPLCVHRHCHAGISKGPSPSSKRPTG